MTTIDKDIDDMQRIIENICPSCEQVGRSNEAHNSISCASNDIVSCIRFFQRLCETERIEYVAETSTVSVYSLVSNTMYEYRCCREDFILIQAWLTDNMWPTVVDVSIPTIQWT